MPNDQIFWLNFNIYRAFSQELTIFNTIKTSHDYTIVYSVFFFAEAFWSFVP